MLYVGSASGAESRYVDAAADRSRTTKAAASETLFCVCCENNGISHPAFSPNIQPVAIHVAPIL